MRALAALVATIGLGCVSAPVVVRFEPVKGIMGGETPGLRSVSIDPKFYGRGCTKIEVGPDGTVSILLQSDATSDWGGFRSAYAIAPEIVEAAAQIVSGPFDILKGMLGLQQKGLPAPSNVGGCHGVVED